MKQASLGAGFELKVKTTRKREFLRQMEQVVPWKELQALIAPHMPAAGPKGGRPPYPVSVLLSIHFPPQRFDQWHLVRHGRIPRLARDRRLSRRPAAAAQPGGCKAHVGTDAASGLAHTVVVTAASVHDVTQAHALLHGQESDVFADAGDPGVDKREEVKRSHPRANWHVAMRPGKRRQLDTTQPLGAIVEQIETVKARIRARGEPIFGVVKCVFHYAKARDKGLKKNAAPITTLFMLANLWLTRRHLMRPCVG